MTSKYTDVSFGNIVSDVMCSRFVSVSPLEVPVEDGTNDQVFISRSYDATSHFETVCDDVHDLWKRITGEPLVLKKRGENEESA